MRRFFIALFLLFPLLLTIDASAQGNAEAGRALWHYRGLNRCVDCLGTTGEGAFGTSRQGPAWTSFWPAIRTMTRRWTGSTLCDFGIRATRIPLSTAKPSNAI